jgi:hypothetical protein
MLRNPPAFYGAPVFVAVYARARHWSLAQASRFQFTTYFCRSILVVPIYSLPIYNQVP